MFRIGHNLNNIAKRTYKQKSMIVKGVNTFSHRVLVDEKKHSSQMKLFLTLGATVVTYGGIALYYSKDNNVTCIFSYLLL